MEIASFFNTYSRLMILNGDKNIHEGTFDDYNEYSELNTILLNVININSNTNTNVQQLSSKYENDGDVDKYGLSAFDWRIFPVSETNKFNDDFMNHVQIDVPKISATYYTGNFKYHLLKSIRRFVDLGNKATLRSEVWDVMLIMSLSIGNPDFRDPFVSSYYAKDDSDISVSCKIYFPEKDLSILTNVTGHSDPYSIQASLMKLVEKSKLPDTTFATSTCKRIEVIKDVLYVNVVIMDEIDKPNYDLKFDVNTPLTFAGRDLYTIKYGLEKHILRNMNEVNYNGTIFDPVLQLDVSEKVSEKVSVFDLLLCACSSNMDISMVS